MRLPKPAPIPHNRNFICECNQSAEFSRLKSESKSCCLRAFGWLKRKYSPFTMQSQLSQKFADVNVLEMDAHTQSVVRKDVVRTFSDSV